MVTVLSIQEYKKLLVEGELLYSSNIDFIRSQDLKHAIKQLLPDPTAGLLTLVASSNNNHYHQILSKTNPLNAILPKPNSPIYLKLSSNSSGLCIRPEVLYLAEDFDLEDEQIRNLLPTFFEEEINKVCYCFVSRLTVRQIIEESYDDSLADEIALIKAEATAHDILYRPLSLF